MDANAARAAITATPPRSIPALPPTGPARPSISPLASYSRSTQLALLLLIAGAVCLVAGQAFLSGRTQQAALDARLDINQASRDDLGLLPGVGPSLADRIAGHREKNGP